MLLALGLAACSGHRDERLLATHAELLTALAAKAEALLDAPGGFRPESLAELRYPYDRASEFAERVGARSGRRAGFEQFQRLLEAYEGMLSAVDRVRAEPSRSEAAARELRARVREVERAGRAVLEALGSEPRARLPQPRSGSSEIFFRSGVAARSSDTVEPRTGWTT